MASKEASMLTSLVCLQQGNVKNSNKLMNLVNIDEVFKYIFIYSELLDEFQWSFLENLLIILRVPKKQCFTLLLENKVFENPHGGHQIYTTAFLALI